MNIDTKISIISTLVTFFAVIVALALGIVPGLVERHRNRKVSERRAYSLLKLIKKMIKDYRIYNPVRVIQDERVQFQYDVSKIKKMTVNIDLNDEIRNLENAAEYLNSKTRMVVLETVEALFEIASGYPKDKYKWDDLENKIESILVKLKESRKKGSEPL